MKRNTFCTVKNCFNSTLTTKDLGFFSFPKDEETCKVWINLTARNDLHSKSAYEISRNIYICGDHFTDDCFVNAVTKNRLRPNSVPSIFPEKPEGSALQPYRRRFFEQDQNRKTESQQQILSMQDDAQIEQEEVKQEPVNSDEDETKPEAVDFDQDELRQETEEFSQNEPKQEPVDSDENNEIEFASNQDPQQIIYSACFEENEETIVPERDQHPEPAEVPSQDRQPQFVVHSDKSKQVQAVHLIPQQGQNICFVTVPQQGQNIQFVTVPQQGQHLQLTTLPKQVLHVDQTHTQRQVQPVQKHGQSVLKQVQQPSAVSESNEQVLRETSGTKLPIKICINADADPFSADLVFPKGVPIGGYIRFSVGRYSINDDNKENVFIQKENGETDAAMYTCFVRLVDNQDIASETESNFKGRNLSKSDHLHNVGNHESLDSDNACQALNKQNSIGKPLNNSDVSDSSQTPSCSDGISPQKPWQPVIEHIEGSVAEELGTLRQSRYMKTNARSLVIHKKKSHADEAPYRCGICDKVFFIEEEYQRHQMGCSKCPVVCSLCSSVEEDITKLYAHNLKHHADEAPFRCNTCKKPFFYESVWKEHVAICRKSLLKCPYCSVVKNNLIHLHIHKKRNHSDQAQFKCTDCEEVFFTEIAERKHKCLKRQRAGKRELKRKLESIQVEEERTPKKHKIVESVPFSCEICSAFYSDYSGLVEHIMADHPKHEQFTCSTCDKKFAHEIYLLSHQLIHKEKDTSYQCPRCKIYFDCMSRLKLHLMSHFSSRLHKCHLCDARFKFKCSVRNHLTSHDSLEQRICDQCGKSFASTWLCKLHKNQTHKCLYKFDCKYCDLKFTKMDRLSVHLGNAHFSELTEEEIKSIEDKVNQCDQCDFKTYSKKSFKLHTAKHTGEYPFKCHLCHLKFVFSFDLKYHIRVSHTKEGGKCSNCPRAFTSKKTFDHHLAIHESKTGFTCQDCDRMYETPRQYNNHCRECKRMGPLQCTICKTSLSTRASLLAHERRCNMRLASGNPLNIVTKRESAKVANFQCEVCYLTFKFKSSMMAHKMFVHDRNQDASGRPTCNICQKVCRNIGVLSSHLRIHTGERPYKCSHCPKDFKLYITRQNHIIYHHTKDFKLHCPLCKRGMIDNANLRAHLRIAHQAVDSKKKSPQMTKAKVKHDQENETSEPSVTPVLCIEDAASMTTTSVAVQEQQESVDSFFSENIEGESSTVSNILNSMMYKEAD